MLRVRPLPALVLLALLASALPAPAGAELLPARDWVVGFHALPEGLVPGAAWQGARVESVLPQVRAVAVASADPSFKLRASADPMVRYVEPDGQARVLSTPDDPRYPEQYEHAQTRLPDAWNVTLGDPAVKVCVVDTGVRYTHEDLAGPRWLGGVDKVNEDDDPWDDHGHGTHVAGIAAASVGNGKGGAGAANVGLMAAKVMAANGLGQWSDVAEGVLWCADHVGPRGVVSISIGGGWSQVVADAIRHAHGKGLLVVAAAGNRGPCDECVLFPATMPEVVGVACTRKGEWRCHESSQGHGLDLAAPGHLILNTCHQNDTAYCMRSGTSDAAPLVSGLAALLWSAQPSLTSAQIRARLNATAQDLGAGGWDTSFGHGEVDAKCLFENRSPCLPPPHDRLAYPEEIPPGLPFRKQVSTRLATTDLGEPLPCGPVGATVWYSWTAPASGTVTAESRGAGFDTVLAAYAGNLTSLAPLGCDDGDADGAPARSSVRFQATAGMTYALQLGGRNGESGAARLDVTCEGCPANNAFRSARPLPTTPASHAESTVGATSEPAEPRPCGALDATVWHKWVAPGSGPATVDTLNSGFDTVLAVHVGADFATMRALACNDDAAGTRQSQVSFHAHVGETYWIQTGGKLGAAGALHLSLQCAACTLAPPNDAFAAARVVLASAVHHEVVNVGAGEEPGEPQACGPIGRTVWFEVTPHADATGIFRTTGSDFDTVLAVHAGEGPPADLTLVRCNDDAGGGDRTSRVVFPIVGNVTYRVQVGGYEGAHGAIRFGFQCVPACFLGAKNDLRGNATPIPALPYSNVQDTIGYGTEPGEPLPPFMGTTAWHRYDHPSGAAPAVVTLDTHGSRFDTVLAVYATDAFVPLGWNDDESELTPGPSRVRFTALPGVSYYVQSGGWSDGLSFVTGVLQVNAR